MTRSLRAPRSLSSFDAITETERVANHREVQDVFKLEIDTITERSKRFVKLATITERSRKFVKLATITENTFQEVCQAERN